MKITTNDKMRFVTSKIKGGKASQPLDQEEDALSFSDLPLNSHHLNSSTSCDDFVGEDLYSGSSSFSPCHGCDANLFEFFSADFDTSFNGVGDRSIVFGGKVIPQRKPSLISNDEADGIRQSKGRNGKLSESFEHGKESWFPKYLRRRRTKSGSEKNENLRSRKANSQPISKSLPKVENRSKLPVNSSRWYWLRLGSIKVSGEMGLNEIKSRQSRQSPKALFQIFDDNCDDDSDQVKRKLKRNRSEATGSSNRRAHRGIAVVRAISCVSTF